VVVGTSVTQDGRTLAFSWTSQHGMRALPLAEGSNARGINNSRLIVGIGTIADRVFEPVVWPPRAQPFVLNVNDLLDANSAEVVNDLNQIAGQFSSQNGTIAAVWTPKKAGNAPEWKRRICQRRFGMKGP
jgi:hypothetical protein